MPFPRAVLRAVLLSTVVSLSFSAAQASHKFRVLYSFSGKADGANPHGTLLQDKQGNLYGTTVQGGAHGYGVVFRLSPDGTQLAMVTLDGGNYRIAVQDLASGSVRVLSHGHLDESPSFAPNGAMLMYAEREGSLGSLATVSVDGLTGLRLKAQQGEVREPAWGPFVQ